MTGNHTATTTDYAALNQQALYAAYSGFVHIRSLAQELLTALGSTETEKVIRNIRAMEGVADALHNVPKLVADGSKYDPVLMKSEVDRSREIWREARL